MALQEKLDVYKTQFEADAPQEVVALMRRATDELRQSGIMEHVLRVGDTIRPEPSQTVEKLKAMLHQTWTSCRGEAPH